ncbi:MAG: heparin lyase I family protein [Bacillota bacterium]
MININIKNKNKLLILAVSFRMIIALFAVIGLFNTSDAQTKSSVPQMKKVSAAIYIYNIDENNTWKGLHNFLIKAKSSGTTVYVGLKPPTKSPLLCSTCGYSEPYRLDFITWAKEIAKLSIRYSNLKGYAIQDFQTNLDLGYLKQSYIDSMIAAGKTINPKLVFDPTIYTTGTGGGTGGGTGDITPPAAPTSLSAVLYSNYTNSNLPLSISPSVDSNWNSDWEIQSIQNRVYIVANPHADAVNPSPTVTRVQILKSDNYSGLANGKPRAEFQRRNFYFTYGHTFRISYKYFIPSNFKFDYSGVNNLNMITQFKQTGVYGPGAPPRCFGHNGTQYYVEDYISVPNGGTIFHRTSFGNAAADAGRWQKWTFEFKADSLSGAGHGYFKLFKNDTLVYSDNDRTWGWTKNTEYYLKLGAYKPDWNNFSSQQSDVTIHFDDIQMTDLTTNVTSTITDFAVSGSTSSNYVDLKWTNPADPDLASINIYSSLTNDSSTAKLLASVSKSVTTYRDVLSTTDKRYYWLRSKDTSGNLSAFTPAATYSANMPAASLKK